MDDDAFEIGHRLVVVCVAAPDEVTARTLRAALAHAARRRRSDRLIRIVVD